MIAVFIAIIFWLISIEEGCIVLCSDCKKRPACVHITQIINNQKTEKNLCEECAKSIGEVSFSFDNQFHVHDFLKGMFSQVFFAGTQSQGEVTCQECNMTYSDFNHNGKVGCSACYTAFDDQLEPLLKRIHGASRHTGKLPKRSGGMLKVKQQIKSMRQQLEQYVINEEYEQAAIMRDKIRILEKQLGHNSKEE